MASYFDNIGLGSMWAQARNAFYKRTGINKKLPAMLGQRAAAAINKRLVPRAAAQPQAQAQQSAQAQAQAQTQTQTKNNNMLYLGGAVLLVIKFLL